MSKPNGHDVAPAAATPAPQQAPPAPQPQEWTHAMVPRDTFLALQRFLTRVAVDGAEAGALAQQLGAAQPAVVPPPGEPRDDPE